MRKNARVAQSAEQASRKGKVGGSTPSTGSDEWRHAFCRTSMKASFCIALSQAMLEMLCAVADGVRWDRALYREGFGGTKPDNWLGSEGALIKRGLIVRIPRHLQRVVDLSSMEQDHLQLTPAGEAMVALLKVAGIFVEADAAAMRRGGAA